MIHHLQPDDIETFKSIRLEALRQDPDAFATYAEDWERLSDDEWRSRLKSTQVFVAIEGTEPVGIMGLMRQAPSKAAHRASIIMVYVRPDQRGTGVADRLLASLTDFASGSGIRQLELMVSAENPAAIGFYRKAGFEQVGLIPNGLLHEGRAFDQIVMARSIIT
ncbi:MAG: GNAT family N-acetyltransferase [Stappiaceae bacterium]